MKRSVLPIFAALAFVSACAPADPSGPAKIEAEEAARAKAAEALTAGQSEREEAAEIAFAALRSAEEQYPPTGADPSDHNANITRAYRAWERAAKVAYGGEWQEAWAAKHAGSTVGCQLARKYGMPLDDCLAAAAREGQVEALEAKLMKCPSGEGPSGEIINPRLQTDCELREHLFRAASETAGQGSPAGPATMSSEATATVEVH